MIDRLRGMFSQDETGKPREWEDQVTKDYRLLGLQSNLADQARDAKDFNPDVHSKRVRQKLTILKDEVVERAVEEKTMPGQLYYLPIEQPNETLFYNLSFNMLITAGFTEVRSLQGDMVKVPDLTTATTVDVNYWSLDKEIVDGIAKGLISLLPPKSAQRILAPADSRHLDA